MRVLSLLAAPGGSALGGAWSGAVVSVLVSVAVMTGCGKNQGTPVATGSEATTSITPTSVPGGTSVPSAGASAIQFRPVLAVKPPDGANQGDTTSTRARVPCPTSTESLPLYRAGELPQCVDGYVVATYELGPTDIDGSALSKVSAHQQSYNGTWSVNPVLRDGADGIDKFNRMAAACYEKGPLCPTGQLAIVLDGVVQSAPTIQEASFQSDEIQISGGFDEASARALAARIDPTGRDGQSQPS